MVWISEMACPTINSHVYMLFLFVDAWLNKRTLQTCHFTVRITQYYDFKVTLCTQARSEEGSRSSNGLYNKRTKCNRGYKWQQRENTWIRDIVNEYNYL